MDEEFDYDDFDEKVKITHKLAEIYGWTWKEIWEDTPYPVVKQLLQLIRYVGE